MKSLKIQKKNRVRNSILNILIMILLPLKNVKVFHNQGIQSYYLIKVMNKFLMKVDYLKDSLKVTMI